MSPTDFRKPLAIIAVLFCAAYVAASVIHQNFRVRYRLTVEVQDGDQVKSGSGVIEVSYDIYPDDFVYFGQAVPKPSGYAITIDLGKKGLLFVTFANADRTPDQRIARNHEVFCILDDIS